MIKREQQITSTFMIVSINGTQMTTTELTGSAVDRTIQAENELIKKGMKPLEAEVALMVG